MEDLEENYLKLAQVLCKPQKHELPYGIISLWQGGTRDLMHFCTSPHHSRAGSLWIPLVSGSLKVCVCVYFIFMKEMPVLASYYILKYYHPFSSQTPKFFSIEFMKHFNNKLIYKTGRNNNVLALIFFLDFFFYIYFKYHNQSSLDTLSCH